jgi:hypothetical protein
MEVQAISGPDIVPQGFSVRGETPVATPPVEERREERTETRVEEKGAVIDAYA